MNRLRVGPVENADLSQKIECAPFEKCPCEEVLTIPSPQLNCWNPLKNEELYNKLSKNTPLTEHELMRCLISCFLDLKKTLEKQSVIDGQDIHLSLKIKETLEKEIVKTWDELIQKDGTSSILGTVSSCLSALLFLITGGAAGIAVLSSSNAKDVIQSAMAVISGLVAVSSGITTVTKSMIDMEASQLQKNQYLLQEKSKNLIDDAKRSNNSLKTSMSAINHVIESLLELIESYQHTANTIYR
jgi:uncharacterized protein YoxC